MMLKTRPNSYDAEICEQVPTEYYPHLIDYAALQTVIDIGAHIGAFATFVKSQSPTCQIKAVELDTVNYALLCVNTRRWKDVTPYHRLCSYETNHSGYYRNRANYGNIGLSPIDSSADYEYIDTVPPRVTLEQLTAGMDSVDLLKLDCEGSEFDILGGARRETLAKFKYIVGEYHAACGDFKALVETLLDFEVIEFEESSNWGHFLLRNKRYGI